MAMISYASVDRIEGNFYVCEVELVPLAQRRAEILEDDQIIFIDIPTEKANKLLCIEEGDILIVEHNGTEVFSILGKSDSEKERRIQFLAAL